MKKREIKILLVDDEPDILEIVGYNLQQEGYQIFTAKMVRKLENGFTYDNSFSIVLKNKVQILNQKKCLNLKLRHLA